MKCRLTLSNKVVLCERLMQFSDNDLRAVTPDIAVDSSITHGGARNRTADGTIYLKKEKTKQKQTESVKVGLDFHSSSD